MERARSDALELQPMVMFDGAEAEIASQNERWTRITDAVLAQLRSKNFKNAELAASLNSFYLYSLALVECSRYTFPNTTLVNKLSKLLPLLPRVYRQTITTQDLTEAEMGRIMKRITKRFDMGPDDSKKKITRMLV